MRKQTVRSNNWTASIFFTLLLLPSNNSSSNFYYFGSCSWKSICFANGANRHVSSALDTISITTFASLFPAFGKSRFDDRKKRMSNDEVKNTIGDMSASVLRELKERIRTQAQEIELLKAELVRDSATTSVGRKSYVGDGGHGGECELSEEELTHYLHDPFYKVGMQRVGWLGIFMASLSATALIMNIFEATLEKHIELALFVPLLAGHGGNTGGQTVGTILSAMSAGTIKVSDAPRVIWKEATAGILSGFLLGAIVSPIAYKILGVSFHVAVVLFFTLPFLSMIASTLGSIIPFLCVLVDLDPSVIAAPAMTSLVDVAGLMGYFMIANYIFNFYGMEL